jgi:hypothetical protein
MSYNGSGTFNINTTGQPVVAGTVISSSAFNSLTNDLATGLTTAITKDGQTTTTARITFAQGFTSSLTTDSSSVSTGSIITAGGVGIAKALYVGTTVNVASTTDSSSISTGSIVTLGGVGIAKALYVGTNANVAGTLGVTGITTFSAQPIFSSLTASSAVATDASKGLVSVTNTGTGSNVLGTSPTITNPLITEIRETATVSATAATGTIQFDALTQVVLYYTTASSGNFTVNFRGNVSTSLDTVMSTGQSLSATFLVTNTGTAYYNSAVTIDGNSVTPKWQGGSAPTSGNASSIDSYTYVIIKTGSATFTVLASVTKFA